MQTQLILLDLDGTLYVGDQPIPGAIEALQKLRDNKITLRFLTNTTTKSQQQLVQQMRQLGFDIAEHELISAPVAARLELQNLQKKNSVPLRIWPLVAETILSDFETFKFDDVKPDYIVLGDIGDAWDLELINRIFQVLHQGAELIALHKNRFWQTEEGLKVDIGFFVSGFEYISGKKARVMGKPNPDFFQRVIDSVGVGPDSVLMVGDDIDTDVGGAQSMGLSGCLVKTGKFRQEYFQQSSVKPHHLLDSVAGLPQLIETIRRRSVYH